MYGDLQKFLGRYQTLWDVGWGKGGQSVASQQLGKHTMSLSSHYGMISSHAAALFFILSSTKQEKF
jgi:hypothetical protein